MQKLSLDYGFGADSSDEDRQHSYKSYSGLTLKSIWEIKTTSAGMLGTRSKTGPPSPLSYFESYHRSCVEGNIVLLQDSNFFSTGSE